MSAPGHSPSSPTSLGLTVPSPIITRRTRTHSTSERTLNNTELDGEIKIFCRQKGHGFITPLNGGEDVFVHISDIEGEYVPLPGDSVKYHLCPIPPKYEKFQAVHVTHYQSQTRTAYYVGILDLLVYSGVKRSGI